MSGAQFDWDHHVGTQVTPVDAVHAANTARQTFGEYAAWYTAEHLSDDITADEMANGMVGAMLQAAHNLASFRVRGSPQLGPHASTIFAREPVDPQGYYAWIETGDENEILEMVTTRQSEERW